MKTQPLTLDSIALTLTGENEEEAGKLFLDRLEVLYPTLEHSISFSYDHGLISAGYRLFAGNQWQGGAVSVDRYESCQALLEQVIGAFEEVLDGEDTETDPFSFERECARNGQ